MKYFKLKYQDGTQEYAQANSSLELIRLRDLATRVHVNTRIVELSGEQAWIAQDYLAA